MRVYKYELKCADIITVGMPQGAVPLHVGIQDNNVCLWAAVEPENHYVDHQFYLAGTGHDRPEIDAAKYIGTFMIGNGTLVFHLFDGDELT